MNHLPPGKFVIIPPEKWFIIPLEKWFIIPPENGPLFQLRTRGFVWMAAEPLGCQVTSVRVFTRCSQVKVVVMGDNI